MHGWIDRDKPHASAVMLADGSLFGRAIDSDGRMRPLRTIAVIGDDLWFWHADPVDVDETGVGRPTSAFGRRMMAELARLTAAVVGASGTGSIMIEQLYRLGFGRVVLVDPEAVEVKNLNRIVNARMRHARACAPKVHVAGEAIEETGLGTRVDVYPVNILDREAIEAVATADVLFGCVDTAEGRDVLNRISTYYLLPYIDIGVGIVPLEDGAIDQINGVVHYVKPGGSSLLSRGAYRPEQVGAEALRRKNPALYEERRRKNTSRGRRRGTRGNQREHDHRPRLPRMSAWRGFIGSATCRTANTPSFGSP